MAAEITRLLEEMSPQERMKVAGFAEFLISSRKLDQSEPAGDDIPSQELLNLVATSGGFDWLGSEGEDVYSVEDGEAVKWPGSS